MPDVFISYSRKDNTIVRRLHESLAAQNRDIWVDWEDIPFTADWWGEICSGIESSDTLIFVISPNSIESPVCNMELAHARLHNKRLVPIVAAIVDNKVSLANLSSREIDDNLKVMLGKRDLGTMGSENWQAISRHNWLMFDQPEKFDTSFPALVNAIEADLDHVRQHTRLLVRAREWDSKKRDESYLLVGTDLQDAERFMAQAVKMQPAITTLHADYVLASQQSAQAERERERSLEQRSRRRLQFFGAAMIVFMLFLVVTILVTLQTGNGMANATLEMGAQIRQLAMQAVPIRGDQMSRLVTQVLQNPQAAQQNPDYENLIEAMTRMSEHQPTLFLSVIGIDPQDNTFIPIFINVHYDPRHLAELETLEPMSETWSDLNTHIPPSFEMAADGGVYMPGQLPITDSSNRVVGLILVEFSAENYYGLMKDFQTFSFVLIAAGALIILGGVVFLVYRLMRRIILKRRIVPHVPQRKPA